jgi:aryl-alcohol dehydrogenase-like predicted oxidoreductase
MINTVMEMEYRRLGKAGLKVSALSYGSWATFDTQLDVEQAEACMKLAYDAGVNFFDNAEVYAFGVSEEIMGTVLKKSGWRRDSYCVSSKVRWGCVENPLPTQAGLSRKHVIEACEQAMQRLGVSTIWISTSATDRTTKRRWKKPCVPCTP